MKKLCLVPVEVERVSSFKFLGVHISEELSWHQNTSALVKKAQQCLYFLRSPKKSYLSPGILTSFYRCIIESILTNSITVWYGGSTVCELKALQRVKPAQRITGTQLPATEHLHHGRRLCRAHNIIKDSSHPSHKLFNLLPSRRRYRNLRTRTSRRCNLKEIGDCKVLAGDSVAIQHQMVGCRMVLEVMKKRMIVRTERRIRWWKLKEEDCGERFRKEVRQSLSGGEEVLDDWETTAEVIRETAGKVLGVTSGNRKEDKETWWWNKEVQERGEHGEQVEKSLESWRSVLERRGMKVSRSKTEYMCVNEREDSGVVWLQGEEVEKSGSSYV
ncbi:gastrula zinc finger protein XlCGF28.1-like [Silurus meridionalis]|nr:gastrula zinc finger protein XlCGF28.1-like [Silurus meridionalis]